MARQRPIPEHQRRFGAHMSIAGGLHRAFERAERVGCDCLQVFVKNQRQWRAPPITEAERHAWHRAKEASPVRPVLAHAAYLINLASPDRALWRRSIEAFVEELRRCALLGIDALIVHPGSHRGRGEAWGLKRVAEALDRIHERTEELNVRTVLETTAGQGSCLGQRFEHLAEIISRVREPKRVGICIDTCHIFAGGYELRTQEGYEATMAHLDAQVGLERIVAFHVNDSMQPLASRRDRHTAIGRGELGRHAFRRLINDPRFFRRPMILETPKGTDARGRDLDRVNLAALRRLIARNRERRGSPKESNS